jgi:hypothetical protein
MRDEGGGAHQPLRPTVRRIDKAAAAMRLTGRRPTLVRNVLPSMANSFQDRRSNNRPLRAAFDRGELNFSKGRAATVRQISPLADLATGDTVKSLSITNSASLNIAMFCGVAAVTPALVSRIVAWPHVRLWEGPWCVEYWRAVRHTE